MKTITLLLALSILLNSCATLFTSSYQTVRFQSNVDGRVIQNLTEIGRTNQEIRIKRSNMEKLYTIKADGCPVKQIELPIMVNPAYWLNMPFILIFGGGLLFAFVDVGLGNDAKTQPVITVNIDDCIK